MDTYMDTLDTFRKPQKTPKKFICDCCDFHTVNKKDFNKHLLTAKHLWIQDGYIKPQKKTQKNPNASSFQCICGKNYKFSQGLSKHKINCLFINNSVTNECTVIATTNNNNVVNNSNISNNEILIELLKQNNELQKQIIEMSKEPKTINNTNNIQFNIHQFLNETCKNAPNFSDFIGNIQVTYDDLENNAKLGFVDGMTKVIVGHLKQLAFSDRPIHCTDIKRETIYVKEEDQWEKEKSKETIQRGIQEITRKNMCQLTEWREENPEYDNMDSEIGEKSIILQQNLMAGCKRDEFYPKIIKNIAKETILDKNDCWSKTI